MSEVTFRCRECGKEALFDARFRDVGLVCGYCYGTAVAVKEPEKK